MARHQSSWLLAGWSPLAGRPCHTSRVSGKLIDVAQGRGARLLRRRHRAGHARVRLVEPSEPGTSEDGSVTTTQCAEVTLPRSELERIWTPEYLERLARTYWRFLTIISLGLLRVLYTETSRDVVLLARPLVLLRFSAPEYRIEANKGTVTWRIDRGMLVAPSGRGRGSLRLSVTRPAVSSGDQVTVTVRSEVASFYPMIAGWGWFSIVGRLLYRATQLRLHVVVTRRFLRSLANLELAPSVVGALRGPAASRSGRRSARAAWRGRAGRSPAARSPSASA